MRIRTIPAIVAMLFGATALFFSATGSAADDAARLVQQALEAEVDGSPDRRESLLTAALKHNSDNRQARWQAGQVMLDGSWTHVGKVSERLAGRPELAEYRSLRDKTPDTSQGHLELAAFCRRNDLPERERAHLTAALALAKPPEQPPIRERLGVQQAGGTWMSRHEMEQAQAAARELETSHRRWLPALKRIASQLEHRSPAARRSGEDELRSIADPAALPAMEAALSQRGLTTARLLIDVLAGMKTHRAAEFLARQAVLSPYHTIRDLAAEHLRERPVEAYAPVLLGGLVTPVQSRVSLYVGDDGVRLTHVLFQENQSSEQWTELVSTTRIVPTRFGVPASAVTQPEDLRRLNRARQSAVLDARLNASISGRRLDWQNTAVEERNERLLEVLESSTGLDRRRDPGEWWDWWQEYNQIYQEGEKPTRRRRFQETRTELVDITPVLPVTTVPPARPSASCLVAGTLVWTDRGPMPIERIRLGDLALSQHAETAELAYKPVLRTTVQPAETLEVHAERTTFRATGGHTFWIAGRGWTKIRDAQPGERFHGANGPVTIDAISPAGSEPTYNLVVADFHTYFVGPSLILSHDPTFARPTDVLVPGLPPVYETGRAGRID